MKKPVIVTMPGDGIGRVVLEEAVRVLDAAGFRGRIRGSRYRLGILVPGRKSVTRPYNRPA